MPEIPISVPKPLRPPPNEHPMVRFNNNADGTNPDWEPTPGLKIPDGIKPTNLRDNLDKVTDTNLIRLGEYKDEKTGQTLHTLWVNKERAEAEHDQPVTIFMQGVGAHVDSNDMRTRASRLSNELGDAPVFEIDYPNVTGSDGFTEAQKKALGEYDVAPIMETWIEAMKKEGLEGREIHIAGESLGGYFAAEFARHIANMEDPPFNITQLHLVDPAGVHRYDDKYKPLRAAHYIMDFLGDAKYNDMYVEAITDPIHRYALEFDRGTARRKVNDLKWVLGQLRAEHPPKFYFGSLLAHGGLPEKLDELLQKNKTLKLTITNMTNSAVFPANEAATMIGGLRESYGERVQAQLLAGDAHSATIVQQRMEPLHRHAFRNDAPNK